VKLVRVIVVSLLCTLYFVLSTQAVKAAGEFSVDATVTYDVQNSGKTLVTHNIALTNSVSDLYATTYSLSLENIDAVNIKSSSDTGVAYTVDTKKNGDITNIKITFPDSVVGKDAKRNFVISYENSSFAVKTGEIWEVTVPRLRDNSNFRNYQVILKVPNSFGLEAYISPSPKNSQKSDTGYTYTFDRNDITQTGITAGFGDFQVFSFNLSYHLDKNSPSQIALPPDTAFQKVYIQNIDPKPDNVTVDADGNWLASYNLAERQRVDVTVSGAVQIFASYRPFPKPTDQELQNDLKGTQYWQVTDPQIKVLADQLKTPGAIYNYVATTLKYDFSRVAPDTERLGAIRALQNPTQAICMEFTDLFIAIARAAGIPAHEINGYAYTENPSLEPLSLVADVLHAWPEYYDSVKGAWIPVDPTWGSTSGGVDYFNKLDLRHFAFVVHGESDTMPYPPGSYKLGTNPQKDVYVSFGKLPDARMSTPYVSISTIRTLPFLSSLYETKILNPGPVALYSVSPQVFFDGKGVSSDLVDILPPYSNYQMSINVTFSLLGKGTPSVVKVQVEGVTAEIATNKTQVITNSLLVISAVLIVIIIIILFLLKKITFAKLFATIAWIFKKKHDEPVNKPPQAGGNTPSI
jgi:transglutaminase-like putative cysteine protease